MQKDFVTSYKGKIANIIAELNELQIKKASPSPFVKQRTLIIIFKDTLVIFKDGLNEGILTIIFATQPKSFSEDFASEYKRN